MFLSSNFKYRAPNVADARVYWSYELQRWWRWYTQNIHTHTPAVPAQRHSRTGTQLLEWSPQTRRTNVKLESPSPTSLKWSCRVRCWCEVACLSQNPAPGRIKGIRHTRKHYTCLRTGRGGAEGGCLSVEN